MPGMGGVGFLKEITLGDGTLKYPVLVLTGRESMSGFFEDMNVAGFLTKPCEPEDLVAKCRAAIGSKAAPPAEEPPRGSPRVMVVEDDRKSVAALSHALEHAGFEVKVAGNGRDAIDKAATWKSDAILMKQVLQGMNGTAIASTLKDMPEHSSLPVVLYDETVGGRFAEAFAAKLPASIDKFCTSADAPALVAAVKEVI